MSLRDANGNVDPKYHDESNNPGLDDSRFLTLRSFDGQAGVYVNRPRIFCPQGSDFQIVPYRRVFKIFQETCRDYFLRRLSKIVYVSTKTGFILEEEALEIEAGVLAALKSQLMQKPKASGVQFTLSRTDNILSTKTLHGDGRLTPLAYSEFISLTLGFLNPALQVVAV